jgi:hypothetical protein
VYRVFGQRLDAGGASTVAVASLVVQAQSSPSEMLSTPWAHLIFSGLAFPTVDAILLNPWTISLES